jgi:hypothetical protein
MNLTESTELAMFDSEDISVVLVKIEASFCLKFDSNAFRNARTFGDVYSIINTELKGKSEDDCTSQQAFYKIRDAILAGAVTEKGQITPATRLDALFPRKGRRQAISELRKESGLPLRILQPRDWMTNIVLLFFLVSLIGLGFYWRLSLVALVADIIALRAIDWFGKEFRVQTVGEVAVVASRESYKLSRRNPNSVNRREIKAVAQEMFFEELGLDESYN